MPVEGIPEFDTALDEMVAKVNEAALEFVKRGAEIIKDEAQKNLDGNSVSTWRSDSWPHATNRSNNLKNSIYMDSARMTGEGMAESTTGPHIIYARRIELGYHGSGQFPYFTTRAFPYFRPGVESARPKLDALFAETVRAAQEA